MGKQKAKHTTSRILILIGSILLFIMAMFHGSGFWYVRNAIQNSSADEFLKEIVPVLFAHPSIHLIGLGALGILTMFLKYESKKILFMLTILVIIDAVLAFMVGGLVPGLLLTVPVICFAIAGVKINPVSN